MLYSRYLLLNHGRQREIFCKTKGIIWGPLVYGGAFFYRQRGKATKIEENSEHNAVFSANERRDYPKFGQPPKKRSLETSIKHFSRSFR